MCDIFRCSTVENGVGGPAAADELAEPPSTTSAPIPFEDETPVGGGGSTEQVVTEEFTEVVAPPEVATVDAAEEEESGDVDLVETAADETPTVMTTAMGEVVAKAGQ